LQTGAQRKSLQGKATRTICARTFQYYTFEKSAEGFNWSVRMQRSVKSLARKVLALRTNTKKLVRTRAQTALNALTGIEVALRTSMKTEFPKGDFFRLLRRLLIALKTTCERPLRALA
jgi:hypothetical protein